MTFRGPLQPQPFCESWLSLAVKKVSTQSYQNGDFAALQRLGQVTLAMKICIHSVSQDSKQNFTNYILKFGYVKIYPQDLTKYLSVVGLEKVTLDCYLC